MQLDGITALVTGANRGIGRAIAEELLARGAGTVYAGVRDPAGVTDDRLTAVALDVTDTDRVAAVSGELGDVSLVVNNAGIVRAGTALSVTLDGARAEIETNYLGLVAMTQAFAPVLAANGGGAFVNVLSIASWTGIPTIATYSASKSAAWGYTNAARVALKAQGTQVVGVHVGYVDTDFTAGLDAPKVAPRDVAVAALDALVEGESEALVDEGTRAAKAQLPHDLELIYPALQADYDAQLASAGR